MKKALIYWFSFLFILLWMTGCGTRKVTTSTIKKETEVESQETEKKDLQVTESTNIKVATDITSTAESTTEKKIYTPVDPTRPSSFIDSKGNKKELNNTSYSEEKTTSKANKKVAANTNLLKDKILKDKGVKKHGTRTKSGEVEKSRNSNRTSLISWWWILLLIVALLIYLYRRYKDKIWWV